MTTHAAARAADLALSIHDLRDAALAWAVADRAADDRAADVQGIERAIANGERPVPAGLVADRDDAVIRLREACRSEGRAEQALREAARRLLDKITTEEEKRKHP